MTEWIPWLVFGFVGVPVISFIYFLRDAISKKKHGWAQVTNRELFECFILSMLTPFFGLFGGAIYAIGLLALVFVPFVPFVFIFIFLLGSNGYSSERG